MVKIPEECADLLKSKRFINRLGDKLVDEPKNPDAMQGTKCYRMFRLSGLSNCINKVDAAGLPKHSLLSARLKRVASIRRKLERSRQRGSTMNLSQIDDIIGLRVVCSTFDDARRLSDNLAQIEDSRVKDYISNPQETGYRAAHHIFRTECSFPNESGKGLSFTFEVQVRTYYQNQWGIWSESYGEQAKENRASAEVKEHLLELSSMIKKWENSHQKTSQKSLPLVASTYNLALVKRRTKLASSFHLYGADDADEALDLLFYWEKCMPEDPDALLLAGVSGLKEMKDILQLTHPTFFRKVRAPKALETNGIIKPIWE